MGYIEMNLNMGITFKARYLHYLHTYLFSQITNLALIFEKLNKICNKTPKKKCFLSFGNISKLKFFTIYIYI
jgi:hypothetical protein